MTTTFPQFTDRRMRVDRLKPGDEVVLANGRIWRVRQVHLLDDGLCALELGAGWFMHISRAESVRVVALVPR